MNEKYYIVIILIKEKFKKKYKNEHGLYQKNKTEHTLNKRHKWKQTKIVRIK